MLRRTLRRVGGQIIVLALVLLDIGGLGFALAAPVWLAPWATINLMAFVVGIFGWSEDRRIQRESATAMQRQAEKSHAAERRNPEECQREAQKQQQAEQAERLRQAEQQLREVEQRRRQEEEERGAQRQQQAEQAERLRHRQRERTQAGAQFQADWWIVLGVAPTANKDEIVRNYRRKIKQCHPDRLVGLAPEFLQLAEERTKALNEAYANAMRTRWQSAA